MGLELYSSLPVLGFDVCVLPIAPSLLHQNKKFDVRFALGCQCSRRVLDGHVLHAAHPI